MKRQFFFIVFLLYAISSTAQHSNESYTGPSGIKISGLVDSAFLLSKASLKNFPAFTVDKFDITGPNGTVKRSMKNLKAILVTDVLKAAGITMQQEKDRGKIFIEAKAVDNYTIIFSYSELFYAQAGKHTFIVFEEEGKPIQKNGPFILLCASDEISGPRHVKWLSSITVRKIED